MLVLRGLYGRVRLQGLYGRVNSLQVLSWGDQIWRSGQSGGITILGGLQSAQVLASMALTGFSLKSDRYVALLEKLIGETEFLQDNPPKFVPQEDK